MLNSNNNADAQLGSIIDAKMHTNAAQKTTQPEANKNDYELDAILVRLGQLGRYQIMIFLLISLPMLFNGIFSVSYIFTAGTVTYRCNITECDGPTSQYRESWTHFAIPENGLELDNCNRYVNAEIALIANQTEMWLKSSLIRAAPEMCLADNYLQQNIVKCPNNNFIFRDQEVTIGNEFGIFCDDEWKLSMVGTFSNIGQFVGIPVGGYIADRYGRVKSLALGGLLSAFTGIIRSFSPSYVFFLIFELLDNVVSSTLYSTSFIMGIELVGPKRRVFTCSLISTLYAVGEVILGLVAKYYPNWRVMLRIIYIPALIHALYFWILPESVRWLLSQGKEAEAINSLKRAARINKRKLSDHTLDKLLLGNREKLQATSESKFPIKQAFDKLFWRIANVSFCWVVNALVFYGLSLTAVSLAGDKYMNFIYLALIEIPGTFAPYLLMDFFGRRYSLFGSMLICGLCCLGTMFTTDEQQSWQLVLFLIGKLAISFSFQVLYFFASEVFPTNLRNSMVSICSMIGRIGAGIAPLAPLLIKYYQNGPALLFTITAITSGCLCLFLPDTTDLILPTTLLESDSIGDKKASKAKANDVQLEACESKAK